MKLPKISDASKILLAVLVVVAGLQSNFANASGKCSAERAQLYVKARFETEQAYAVYAITIKKNAEEFSEKSSNALAQIHIQHNREMLNAENEADRWPVRQETNRKQQAVLLELRTEYHKANRDAKSRYNLQTRNISATLRLALSMFAKHHSRTGNCRQTLNDEQYEYGHDQTGGDAFPKLIPPAHEDPGVVHK